MRKRGFAAEPEFIRGLPVVGGGSCQFSEVCGGGTELVPERGWSVTGESHGTRLPQERSVETFSPSILCQCIGALSGGDRCLLCCTSRVCHWKRVHHCRLQEF